ncbi:hypothetical protein IRY61_05230 [Candidatus Saccharibacteria bacterium]|nr:hypothetical protein [Candidatus Saccharibacteria bacterium]
MRDLFDRPVAFHRCFVRFGGVNAALFLSQAVYWSLRSPGGWFWKTAQEWEEETGLSWREQKTARMKLVGHGVLEEKEERLSHRMYFRVDVDKIGDILGISKKMAGDDSRISGCEIPESQEARFGDCAKRDPSKEQRLSSEITIPPYKSPQGGTTPFAGYDSGKTESDTDGTASREGDGGVSVCGGYRDRGVGEKSLPAQSQRLTKGVDGGFERFWSVYPVKVGKQAAAAAWKRKVAGKVDAEVVVRSVAEHRRRDPRWREGFVPNPATYLNQGRWLDELPEPITLENL